MRSVLGACIVVLLVLVCNALAEACIVVLCITLNPNAQCELQHALAVLSETRNR